MADKTAKPHVTVMQNMSRMDVKQKITTDGALSEAELFFSPNAILAHWQD